MEKLREMEKARQEMKRQAFESAMCHKIVGHFDIQSNAYTELSDQLMWDAWQAAQEQVLQAIHSDMKDTYYWDGAEYVVDRVNEYEMDLERGEIAELEKWKRTKEVKVYVAAIYSNEDDFELVEFESEEKAKNAVQENLLMLDTLEKQPPRHHLL